MSRNELSGSQKIKPWQCRSVRHKLWTDYCPVCSRNCPTLLATPSFSVVSHQKHCTGYETCWIWHWRNMKERFSAMQESEQWFVLLVSSLPTSGWTDVLFSAFSNKAQKDVGREVIFWFTEPEVLLRHLNLPEPSYLQLNKLNFILISIEKYIFRSIYAFLDQIYQYHLSDYAMMLSEFALQQQYRIISKHLLGSDSTIKNYHL